MDSALCCGYNSFVFLHISRGRTPVYAFAISGVCCTSAAWKAATKCQDKPSEVAELLVLLFPKFYCSSSRNGLIQAAPGCDSDSE